MTRNLQKILIIEDETEISNLMKMLLERKDYSVECLSTAVGALEMIKDSKFDLIILDWMLPGLSGFEFLSTLRDYSKEIPVLMITAKTHPDDIVNALDHGADDYITKPFENSIFLARVQVLLRRANQTTGKKSPGELRFGNLQVNTDSYEVFCDGAPLTLTVSEFKILVEMIENQGKVMTRDHLIRHVQGDGISVTGRTIDTHIFGLRKKLGENGNMIDTVRGIGYRIKID